MTFSLVRLVINKVKISVILIFINLLISSGSKSATEEVSLGMTCFNMKVLETIEAKY